MTNASITRKLFWLERPQKHYADQVRHPGGGHGVRGDGAVRAAHRQLGFGGARAAAGAWAKACNMNISVLHIVPEQTIHCSAPCLHLSEHLHTDR